MMRQPQRRTGIRNTMPPRFHDPIRPLSALWVNTKAREAAKQATKDEKDASRRALSSVSHLTAHVAAVGVLIRDGTVTSAHLEEGAV